MIDRAHPIYLFVAILFSHNAENKATCVRCVAGPIVCVCVATNFISTYEHWNMRVQFYEIIQRIRMCYRLVHINVYIHTYNI